MLGTKRSQEAVAVLCIDRECLFMGDEPGREGMSIG